MKKLITILFSFLLACNTPTVKIENIPTPVTQVDNGEDLIVGKEYIICSEADPNPFESRTVAPVTIVDKKAGYVKYCWTKDLHKGEYRSDFSRSFAEFYAEIKACK